MSFCIQYRLHRPRTSFTLPWLYANSVQIPLLHWDSQRHWHRSEFCCFRVRRSCVAAAHQVTSLNIGCMLTTHKHASMLSFIVLSGIRHKEMMCSAVWNLSSLMNYQTWGSITTWGLTKTWKPCAVVKRTACIWSISQQQGITCCWTGQEETFSTTDELKD